MEKVMFQTSDGVIEQDSINGFTKEGIKSIVKVSKTYRAVQIIKNMQKKHHINL